jgi:hypothetical protein
LGYSRARTPLAPAIAGDLYEVTRRLDRLERRLDAGGL